MCLAVPVKVLEIIGDIAVVDAGGNALRVDVSMVDGLAPGDWVIVHAGFAIQKYSPEEAAETLKILGELAQAAEDQ